MKLILLVILSSLFGCTNKLHIEPKYHVNQNLCISRGFYQGCKFRANNFGFDNSGYYYIGYVECNNYIYNSEIVEDHLEECKK